MGVLAVPDVLRAVIFVDGQNFHKNLNSFAFEADPELGPYRLDEQHFLWADFFRGVIRWFDDHTGIPHRLLRAYWYNAETITPFGRWPAHVSRALSECRETDPCITEEQLVRLAEDWHNLERRRFDVDRRSRLEEIQRRTDFLEFRFIGQYRVQPFKVYKFEKMDDGTHSYQGTREGEKGVDIGMATDMIAKMPYYDVAVLVSGDADFIPAVRFIKDHLKLVYQFSVAKGIPPQVHYLSPWLKGVADAFGHFDELQLLTGYLDTEAPMIPPAIRAEIKCHIEKLQASVDGASPGVDPHVV